MVVRFRQQPPRFSAVLRIQSRSRFLRSYDAVAPFGLFLKFNSNACDVGLFTLDQRIDVLVRRSNAFLGRPASFFTEAAIRDEKMLPQVDTMFYHSNQGHIAVILALLEQSNGSHIR